MNCFLSNVMIDFYKGHLLVSISTGLVLLVLNVILKICGSEEKQMIFDVIIVA